MFQRKSELFSSLTFILLKDKEKTEFRICFGNSVLRFIKTILLPKSNRYD